MERTILIVEDSLTQSLLLENILQRNKYNTVVSTSAESALEWLKKQKPSIVISDIVMPGMNGFELCRKIKTNPTTSEIPVVLLTSLTGTKELIEGLNAGADSFITKPFDQDYLIEHIAKILLQEKDNNFEKKSFGLEITFEGKKRIIQTDQNQMIRLLINIYEGAIQQNSKLLQVQNELRNLNDNLESLVAERTSELNNKNALFRALINSPDDMIIFALDRKYCYTTFNENHRSEMKKIWNVDIQEGTNILECMTNPELNQAAKLSIDRAMSGEFFSEIQHGPDDDIYYELSWNPIIEKNEIIGVTVYIKDISERKKNETLLQQEKVFTNTMIDNLPGLFYLYNYPELNLVRWNKNHELLLGYNKNDLKNLGIKNWVDPVARDYMLNEVEKVMTSGANVFEADLKTKNQHLIPFIMNGAKIELQGKNYIMGFGIDATNLKKAEAEIIVKNAELERVNAEKDKFFSIIAHDLRSPFSSFLGLTEILVEEIPNMKLDKIQQMAISMKNSALSLYRLIENLLEWAKIQRGLVPFDPKVCILLPILTEVINMNLESAKTKSISIHTQIANDLEAFVDCNMLQTILRNLISNAIKFTPKGGNVYLSSKVDDSKNIEISVRDTGVGMNATIIENIFKINSKTNRQGTEGEPSSGLGLILCKEFIEKMGGRINIKSEVEKGSEFAIILPKLD